jgi:hypothetical protein
MEIGNKAIVNDTCSLKNLVGAKGIIIGFDNGVLIDFENPIKFDSSSMRQFVCMDESSLRNTDEYVSPSVMVYWESEKSKDPFVLLKNEATAKKFVSERLLGIAKVNISTIRIVALDGKIRKPNYKISFE